MATLTQKDIEKILERQAPGFRVAANQHVARRTPVAGTARTPDLETIRRRYGNIEPRRLSGAARRAGAIAEQPAETDKEDTIRAVIIEPRDAAGISEPKSVLIDVKKKKIVSAQD